MATTIVSTSTTPTLAHFKVDCKTLARYLEHGGYPAQRLSAGAIAALHAIADSTDTTNLETTT